MRLRSISLKLTLAFLVVGLLGAALVALYVGVRTRRELDRLLDEQVRIPLVAALTGYYRDTGSWEGVEGLLRRPVGGPMRGNGMPGNPMAGMMAHRAAITLADGAGVVVYSTETRTGVEVPQRRLQSAVPLDVDGEVVGYLIYQGITDRLQAGTPERIFLMRVRTAIGWSGVTAALAALLVGGLLARTLMRPIHALTTATHAIAHGDLGRQVEVRGQDELGELSVAFNRMSADLARTTELRRQMTADIAHDLRTPLSILMGYTEALSDGKLKGNPETYAVMHREAQHLDRLVSDLRLISLADAGELPLNRVAMAPATLLARAAAAHVVQAEEQEVGLQVRAPDDLPAVLVDPERMAQVLGNLIANALRYTPAGGTVTLAAGRNGSTVTLTVADTGTGVPPQDLPNVFERFYRGDAARQQSEGESGLGLAIVKSLVAAHGGTIRVANAPEGGAVFTITLSVAARG